MLKKIQPFLKAIAPSVLGLAGALVNWFVTGAFDRAAIGSLVLGFVTAIVVYFVPNA